MGNKTKIDWADATWNPVTGCLHGCEYCYARRIAKRFGGSRAYERWFCAHDPFDCGRCNECNSVLDKPVQAANGKIDPYRFLPTFHRYKLDEPQKWKK